MMGVLMRRNGSGPNLMRKKSPWATFGHEPPLAELLGDPIIQVLMRADGVAAGDVVELIRNVKLGNRITLSFQWIISPPHAAAGR
jgi:hypothetical protein